MKKPSLFTYSIHCNGLPYQGEGEDVVNTGPRWTGWTGHSPQTRSRIKLGHPLEAPCHIQGRTNLRSHIERILAAAGNEVEIQTLEITLLQ